MENKDWEYRKVLVMSDVPIKGTYRFNDLFQILPAEEKAPKPPYVLAHHPCIIEFRFKIDKTPRQRFDGYKSEQWIVNNDDARKVLKEILLLMNLFSFHQIFDYFPSQSWFIPMGNDKIEDAQWGQNGYWYDGFESKITTFSDGDYDPIELIDTNKYLTQYGRVIGQGFDLPDRIDMFLKQYFELTDSKRQSFLSACSLFNQGRKLWSEHPSLSFTALVSSLETLIEIDFKKKKVESCKDCGQKKYSLTEKFRDFFGKYGSPSPEFREYATRIYKQRSKILHTGKLFLGEVEPIRFGSWANIDDDQFRRNVVTTCRICMINWLLKQNNTK
ncbi:MAG: hypothetical protein AB1763_08155 [Campylobacterota bacterium]